MSNLDDNYDLPTLTMIMNRYSSLRVRGGQIGGGKQSETQQFLKTIDPKVLKMIKNAIYMDNQQHAIQIACNTVVKYFAYIPMKQCIYHGEFVYELLKAAIKQK